MKKKILLIIALIVLLVPAFIFLVPVKEGRTIYKNIKYKQLLAGAVQPDNYDKMKISYARIVERTTGTPDFNTPNGQSVDDDSILSDMEGHDVSEKDNFVRTYDYINYRIEFGVALNTDNPNVNENTQLTGGVVKVKATINDNEADNLLWITNGWMSNVEYSQEGRTIYAEYRIPAGETIVGGNQQLSLQLYAGKFAKEITGENIIDIEIWMEGNKPDNDSSLAEKMEFSDNEDLIITGALKDNVYVNQANSLNISGKRNNLDGQYISIGNGAFLSTAYGTKGNLFPVDANNAEIEIEIEYYYKNVTAGDTNYTLASPEELNNWQVIAYNMFYESNPDAFPTPTSNNALYMSNLYKEETVTYREKTMNSDFGDVQISIDNNILKINYNGFSNDIFAPPNESLYTAYASNYFSYSYELFLPHLTPDSNASYEYQIKYKIKSAKLKDDDGNEVYDLLALDTISSDNSNTLKYSNYLSGAGKAVLHSNILFHEYYENTSEDGYTYENAINSIYSDLTVTEGPYYGGEERLITFESNKLKIVKKDDKWYEYTETNSGHITGDTPLDNQTIKYGIYKLNPSIGLDTSALVNSTLKDDFDWYESVEAAEEHGTVTAILWNNPDYDGNTKKARLTFYVQPTDVDLYDASTAILRHKVWFYADVERTKSFSIYDSVAEDYFKPSQYDEYYYKTSTGSPSQAGEGLLIIKGVQYYDIGGITYNTSNQYKTVFNVLDDKIKWNVKLKKSKTIGTPKEDTDTVYIGGWYDQKYVTLLPETCDIQPYSIGTREDYTLLKWKIEDVNINTDFPLEVNCYFRINPLTPNNTAVVFGHYTNGYGENNNPQNGFGPTYVSPTVTIMNLSGSSTRKYSSKDYIELNDLFTITGNINNISDATLQSIKTIELLPKNNDSRGSVIHGSYSIEITELAEGMTIYYSTGNIDEIGIETDGLGYKHIQNVDLENDSRWIQVELGDTIPANATAIATLTDEISTQTSKGFTYTVNTSGNESGDVYYFGQYASSDSLQENIFSTYNAVTVVERKIGGKVFDDLNRNDIYNDTDALEIDYEVLLLNEEGTTIATTRTNNNGRYEFDLPGKGNYYIKIANLSDGYEVIPKGTSNNHSKINSDLKSDLINQSGVANEPVETVENINIGIRKKPATLIVKYLDKNNNQPLADQTESTVYYTDPYETHGLTTIPENYSFLETAGAPVADVVNSDYIEVIYYYDYTPATITAKHYIDGTTTKIHEDVIQNKKLTQQYSTSVLDTTNLNYEYVRTDGDNTSGTVDKTEIVVNYYYRLKKGTVTTHHYLYDNGDTTTKLAPDVTKEWNYTDTYTTSVSDQVPANYELYKKSDNYTNIMSSPSVEVSYYYRLKDSNLTTSITKTGTEEITAKDSEVNYTITYNAEVSEYIGDATITIVDTLPYAIDVDNSDLDGGTYNANDKTITWIESWTGIDTYNNNNQKTITKNIKLVYDGIVGRDRIMTNTTTGTITLSNNSREAQAQTSTNIRIKGKIKVIYIDSETNNEIFDAVEEEDLVGEEFISVAKEKDGYKLVTKPDSETFEFEEEDQLITYGYEHIKFEIKGKVLGVGGKIRGDEDVYWGDDSTEGNIIVEADDGYIIEAILVNGERMDIEPGQVTLVLENFKEVLENKNIEVVFAKKPQENPNTKAFIGLIILISWLILFTNAILLKKSQELE